MAASASGFCVYNDIAVGIQWLLDHGAEPVSYTHLRAHETVLDLVCRLLLEKNKHAMLRLYTRTEHRTKYQRLDQAQSTRRSHPQIAQP